MNFKMSLNELLTEIHAASKPKVFFHSYQTQSLVTFLPKKVYGLMSSKSKPKVFFHSYQTQSLVTFLPKKVYVLMSSKIELPFEIYKACVKFTLRGLGIFNDFIFCR